LTGIASRLPPPPPSSLHLLRGGYTPPRGLAAHRPARPVPCHQLTRGGPGTVGLFGSEPERRLVDRPNRRPPQVLRNGCKGQV